MNTEIMRQVQKRGYWTILKKHNTEENRQKYSKIEKQTKNMIRNAKQYLQKNLASGLDKNNRKFVRYIKSKTKSQSTIGPLVTADKRLRGSQQKRKKWPKSSTNTLLVSLTKSHLTMCLKQNNKKSTQKCPGQK
jgi:hypothetical protein